LGDFSLINNETIVKTIAGFHACTVIKTLNSQILENVYHYNKNAVYFSKTYQISWQNMYNPIIIRLTEEETDVSKSILGINNIIEDFPKILDSKNVDVGDHSSQDSSNMVTQSPNECLLCRIRDHNTENVEHILYETKNFYVVPGTGAFFEGYLMIVPKDHVMSFALLEESKLREFYRVLDDIRFIQESIYGKKVFAFECASGRTGAGKHKTSIVHAHFHLAPTDMPVLQEVNKSGIHPQPIQKEALCEYGEHPYMLYVDQEDNWSIACDPNCYYPRQQPRQVLANWMDCYKIYNWRFYPFREKMDIIATQFREFCRNNYNNLPEWVKTSVVFDD
jgi:diadenosine tetraphosphate (Ap4A) HIT family hydrolase